MKLACLYVTIVLALFCALNINCFAQDDEQTGLLNLPSCYFDKVSGKTNSISNKLDATTVKILSRLQKREEKLKNKLYTTDSLAAKNIFNEAESHYRLLKQKLDNPQQLAQYIPYFDTLKSSLRFISQNKGMFDKIKGLNDKLDNSMTAVNNMEGQLQKAEAVKQFLREEKQFLKDQLEKFGFVKQLKKLNKDVYYYSQQVNDYKEIIKNPKRIERKAIDVISRTKLFQDFMKKNSMLASLFRMPADDPNDPAYMQSLAGLQTRTQVNQFIQEQFGSAGAGAMRQVQNSVQQARDQLQQLKDKVTQYGSSSDDIMPEGFKPSSQKTKSFFKRLEFGSNIQTQKAQYYFPVTSDLGLSVGYKLNDKSIIGIGASYKLGLGTGWKDIRLSQEGVGLRSYVDWKLKGSFWISGGFETNYRTLFTNSGLIGLSKVVAVRSNFFKKTKLQLLWDFLSYQQVPKTQSILFRIGYGFN